MRLPTIILTLVIPLISISQQIDSAWIEIAYSKKFSRDTGIILPDYTFIDEAGNKKTLAEYKGMVLYLNIWSQSCGNCIAQFPHAEQLVKRLKAARIDTLIQLINICIDDSKSEWKKNLKKYKPVGINLYCADTTLTNLWHIDILPRHILLNPSGKVMCYLFSGPDDGIIDYTLYSATKGIKPADAVWIDFQQLKYFRKYKKFVSSEEGIDYERWYQSVLKERIEYFKWNEARRSKKQ